MFVARHCSAGKIAVWRLHIWCIKFVANGRSQEESSRGCVRWFDPVLKGSSDLAAPASRRRCARCVFHRAVCKRIFNFKFAHLMGCACCGLPSVGVWMFGCEWAQMGWDYKRRACIPIALTLSRGCSIRRVIFISRKFVIRMKLKIRFSWYCRIN